jgi:hypothetical protein
VSKVPIFLSPAPLPPASLHRFDERERAEDVGELGFGQAVEVPVSAKDVGVILLAG